MTRDDAWNLLCEWTQSDALRRHMLGVEAAMRWYAKKYGEDEERWGLVGILHDFDYEKYPEPPDHPLKGAEVLREKGYPEDVVRAILAGRALPVDTLREKVPARLVKPLGPAGESHEERDRARAPSHDLDEEDPIVRG